ncbi:MAG: nucleotidyl transferase AbiEii/AbiGii toxin family protein [archaeon]
MIKIARLEDILCMKVNAIIFRGSRKDFVDVYFIIKAFKVESDEVMNLFKKKFGAYNELVIKKISYIF